MKKLIMNKKLKILIVNKYHYLRGGDCTHVFALAELLKGKGHEVRHFSMHHPKNFKYEYDKDFISYIDFPQELKKQGIKPKLRVLFRMLYSKEARDKFRKVLNEFKPDIIHFHNLHKHLTTSILLEANKRKIPIVWTLHDYNLICPNISFISSGKICEKCRKLKYIAPVIERCSNNSIYASTIIVIEKLVHDFQMVKKRVDMFISPSFFLKKKFVEYGFPERKVKVIPNFYETKDNYNKNKSFRDKYYLYLGRLSLEKGVATLCEAAKLANINLIVAGSGSIKENLDKQYSSKNIKFVGYKSGNDLINLRRNAWFVVIPSELYENNPLSVIESLSEGVPVIGTRIGGIPELVKENQTGFIYESKDVNRLADILRKTNKLNLKQRNKLGLNGRKQIMINNNPETYYKKLLKIYRKAIKEESSKWKH